jgi:hypothetical protein
MTRPSEIGPPDRGPHAVGEAFGEDAADLVGNAHRLLCERQGLVDAVLSSKGVDGVATPDAGEGTRAMCNRTPPVAGVDSPTTRPGRRLAKERHADRAGRAGPGPRHT